MATTYAELDRLSDACARRLAAAGVGPGDRVATTLPASIDLAALLHALPRVGAALVPLNTRLTAAERRWQLEDCGARLLVEEPLAGPAADRAPAAPAPLSADRVVIYTSGTTSTPKPVSLSHANFLASALASAERLGVEPDDRWLCVLPTFHVGGLSILTRSTIYGTAAILHDGFDTAAVARSLASGEATLVSLVATMVGRLREAGLEAAPALRAGLVGGGPVPGELLRWATEVGLPLVQTYGMTETCSQVATLAAREAAAVGSAGRPLAGVRLRIAEDGEILVRGAMVARGALAPDGWLHTGDRGRVEGGYLYVEGRIKDTIVSGGENVAPAEVEDALLTHPAIVDAAVVGRPDPEWGEAVTAFVAGDPVDDRALIAHCRSRLAAYKVPRSVIWVERIPRNATGKIARDRLP